MKLAITSLLVVASMSAVLHAGFCLRAAAKPEATITTSNQSIIDNNNERELLSPWCDPTTPVKWHPNYSQSWSISGCVQKADCDSPGYDNQATCCAAQYGGQTGGACSTAGSATANPNNGKFYADYSTPWFTAGCKNTLPHPPSAAIFYTTQLQCCKAAFGGQTSNACVMGLPSPPTAKPSVALTTIAPITKSPTTEAGQGGGWYADYGTPWPNAGCKNTIPLPVYATMFYTTQLACCKAAFGGQYSGACIKGLPNPPTLKPTITTAANQSGVWYADYGTPWLTGGCKNTLPLPNHAIIMYSSQLKCCKGAYGGQISNACIKGLPNPPTKLPVLKPSFRPSQITDIIVYPTAGQSISPTISNPTPSFIPTTTSTSTQSPSARPNTSPSTSPSQSPTASTPTERPSVIQLLTTSTTNPTASPSQSPTNLTGDSISSPSQLPSTLMVTAIPTASLSLSPTASPTSSPTTSPSLSPMAILTASPSLSLTASPTASPSQSPTESPTASPTASPSQSPSSPTSAHPTSAPSEYFFPDKNTLQTAVNSYISQNCSYIPSCSTQSLYGEIGTWRVSKVTDFTSLFQSKTTFNSDISSWDVSAGTDMRWMFNGASKFNIDISNWNIGSQTSVTSMGYMFYYATSFNQNLCPWGSKLPTTYSYATNAGSMFLNSGCTNKNRPTSSAGPWCAVTTCS